MAVSKPSISKLYRLSRNIKPWGRYAPAYIVIHFTGGFYKTSDSISGMLSSYKSFLSTGSNAHYLVGNDAIWEMVDPHKYYCTWSCGSPVGRKNACAIPGWGPTTYAGPLSMSHSSIAGHTNTINVEMCSCKVGSHKCDPMDDGWYFNDGTYANSVKLCAWLCDEFGIKISNIIMHNQVTGKICPAMWCNKKGAEAGFDKFKEDVALILNEISDGTLTSPNKMPTGDKVKILADSVFYSRPSKNAPIVYMAENDMSLEYTIKQGIFYYTSYGWTVNDSI